jgi:hypothetical protein
MATRPHYGAFQLLSGTSAAPGRRGWSASTPTATIDVIYPGDRMGEAIIVRLRRRVRHQQAQRPERERKLQRTSSELRVS